MARLAPQNRTGTGGEDLLSNNFNWEFPLVGLKGRGLDLGLTLSYNSLVWVRSGDEIDYDVDDGSIAPGFRLGFPTVEGPYWNNQANTYFYLLVTPSGARIELRYVGGNAYQAQDSSYLQLLGYGTSLLVRSTDGTQLNFVSTSGTWRCNQIKDRNGNYQTITYNSSADVSTITEALGRVLTFNYDGYGNLLSITQVGRAQPWATFGWGTASITHNFSLTNLGPANTTIPVLTRVGLADGSAYEFYYNSAGQVMKVARAASDGWHHSYSFYDYNYPGDDCPRIIQRRDWATNWSDQQGVPHEVATSFTHDADGGCRVTFANGTVHKEYYGSNWQSRLTIETRSYATVADANSNAWQKKTTSVWTQDNTSVSYLTNPRVTETNTYDASGNRRRNTVEYTSYGLPSQLTEYAADAATVLRRTTTTYFLDSVYINKRIIGLPREIQIYDANNQPVSKTWFDYDWGGDYWASLPASAVQHDPSGDHTGRGLLCWIGKWDTLDPNNFDKTQRFHFRYNRTGSLIRSSDPLWHETNISYTDSFADGINRYTFAYPTTITDPGGFQSSVQYNYALGAVTRTQGPPPAGQSQGAIQTMQYDDAGRITRVTTANNDAYTRYLYGADYVESLSSVNYVTDEAYTFQLLNGRGQVFISGSNHPGSSGGYRAQVTYYDVMGRVMKQSNPAEINGSWVPAGDDVAGWVFSQQTYNWQGKPLVTTNQDGTQKYASYAGCGCAGGEVVTIADEVGRQQKLYSDVVGRKWKSEVLNWNGTVYSTTTNTFNARDQVTLARQWAGAENGGGAYQDTTMSYDGYGRLQSKHVPEQSTGTAAVYAYNSDDTVQSLTDARGAVATYSYNNRHLVTGITYSAPGGITPTSNVTFDYDAVGNRTSMSDGSGSTTYQYNSLSQMTSEARTFAGLSGSYTLAYEYALSGAVKKVTDQHVGTSFTNTFDTSGRVNGVSTIGYGGGFTQTASNLQYRAWGAAKAVTFSNNTSTTFGYNSRLQLTSYSLLGANSGSNPLPVASTYQYYTDGQIKFAQDQGTSNSITDRAYQYDHTTRLQEAFSGSEARDFINNTNSGTATGPYRQSFTYDAWDNALTSGGRFWSRTDVVTATYNQSNRNPNWSYDAEGNVTSRNETFSGGASPGYSYDAAGRKASIFQVRGCWLEPQHLYKLHVHTNTHTYDGDGQVTRYEQAHRVGLNMVDGWPVTTYYLRSSVLGGRVISQYDQTEWNATYVYAGGQRIGLLSKFGEAAKDFWRANDPVTGDEVNTTDNGVVSTQTRLDPNGVDVGFEDPFPPLEEGSSECVEYDPNYVPSGPVAANLIPDGESAKCIIDGIEQNCQSVGSEAAVRCPDNDCGPRRWTYTTEDGERITGVTNRFQAVADGYSGFLPAGWTYTGDGVIFNSTWTGDASEKLNFNDITEGSLLDAFTMNFLQKEGKKPKRSRRQRQRRDNTIPLGGSVAGAPANSNRDSLGIDPDFRGMRCRALQELFRREASSPRATGESARISSITYGSQPLDWLDNQLGTMKVEGVEIDQDWLLDLKGVAHGNPTSADRWYRGGKRWHAAIRRLGGRPLKHPAPYQEEGERNAVQLAGSSKTFREIFDGRFMSFVCGDKYK